MNRSIVNPAHILDSYRKSDAVIIVCQNNALRNIEVAAINEEAARVLGFSNAELLNAPFDRILPERVSSTIAEFVDYKDSTHDLLAVLLKIRNFSVKSREGRELPFRLRVIRGEEIDKNPWFHLVLVDEGQQHQSNAFRDMLRENFKGHEALNEQTSLPNRLTTIKNIELVINSVQKSQVNASFAVFDINGYDTLRSEYGQQICHDIHRHIGQICKQKLRPEDAIGTLSERSVAILLVDAPQEDARMVLNRLRWIVSATPLTVGNKDVAIQVNVGFTEIDGKISATDVLEKCEGFTISLRNKQFNAIQLAVTHERRGSGVPVPMDRRAQNIAVEIERRRRERRGE